MALQITYLLFVGALAWGLYLALVMLAIYLYDRRTK